MATEQEWTQDALSALPGPVVLEFGAAWCGHCQALAPLLAEQLQEFTGVRHIRVEDGKGKPLGRSFKVKLWPTLVFLRDGQVVKQLVRPEAAELRQALQAITQ